MNSKVTQLHFLLRVLTPLHISQVCRNEMPMPPPNHHHASPRLAPNILQHCTFKQFPLLVVTATSGHAYANSSFHILLDIPQRAIPPPTLPLILGLIGQHLVFLVAKQREAIYAADLPGTATPRLCVGAPDNGVKDCLCPLRQGIPCLCGVGVVRNKSVRDDVVRGKDVIERFRYMAEEEDRVPGGETVCDGDEELCWEALEG